MRPMQSAEHGDESDCDRKVNCLFTCKSAEISNIKFKHPDIGDKDLVIQSRNDVQLARCMQEAHLALGIEDPSILMADVSGNGTNGSDRYRREDDKVGGQTSKD
ncbi:hypothetical protein BG011_006151 [Mortierella polycephala]|uniref:Uncharacterized protein n=1 Tax=Mortierella polycephala TaxID=41804 RepID=A0A9P6PWS5_9FUNG|nr:hypothetical protein BG011_006151 [Mortierella polycephala]